MDPQTAFCCNPDCKASGQTGQGNIHIHSRQESRFKCTCCGKTFAATKGTPFYRLHKDRSLFVCVLTLLSYGCPVQAIVNAFDLDERTVASWRDKAGCHCQAVQQHFLENHPLDLQHVQADELYAKTQGGRCWMAMAMAVPYRLWLGGVVSPIRDLKLIQRLVNLVRLVWCAGKTLLICVDGLSSYVTAFFRAFRQKVMTGRPGRPRLRLPSFVWLAQVIKSYAGRCLKDVARRVVWGTEQQVQEQLRETDTGEQINTSYIERLNATFRACLGTLVRRGRALAKKEKTLLNGMYLVGCVYNFCTEHDSLGEYSVLAKKKWRHRTPAMAAGWADRLWSVADLLSFRLPPKHHG
jgi:transposase-like protein